MKKIEAVIRRTRFEETKEALLENGVEWFSYVDVRGSGHARNRRVYRGVMYETDIIERMMLTTITASARGAATSRSITSARPKRWRPGLRRKSKYERRLG